MAEFLNFIVKFACLTNHDYELILTSHLHHFSCDEKNEVLVVSNSSLMGTDDYAAKLRLSAKPS